MRVEILKDPLLPSGFQDTYGLYKRLSTRKKLEREAWDIDKDIREFVYDLWNAGYATLGSCAGGHPGHKRRGFVSFIRKLTPSDLEEVHSIAEIHGITVTDYKYVEPGSQVWQTTIWFLPLG